MPGSSWRQQRRDPGEPPPEHGLSEARPAGGTAGPQRPSRRRFRASCAREDGQLPRGGSAAQDGAAKWPHGPPRRRGCRGPATHAAPSDGGSSVPASLSHNGNETSAHSQCSRCLPGGQLKPATPRGAERGAGCLTSRLYSKVSRRSRLLLLGLFFLWPWRGTAAHRPAGLAAPEGAEAAAPLAGEARGAPARRRGRWWGSCNGPGAEPGVCCRAPP